MKKIVFFMLMFGLTANAKPMTRTKFIKSLQSKATKIVKKGAYRMDVLMTVHSPGGDMKMSETIFRQGKKLRVETRFISGGAAKKMPAMFANMKTVTIKTPKGTWMITPMGTQKVKNKALPPGIETADWVTRIADHIGKVHKVANGWLVELKKSGNWTEALFSNNLDIVQMLGQNKQGQKLRMVFGEYSDDGGIHMPRHLKSFMGKRQILDMKVVKIEKNQSFSPGLFDPAKVKVKPMPMPSGL